MSSRLPPPLSSLTAAGRQRRRRYFSCVDSAVANKLQAIHQSPEKQRKHTLTCSLAPAHSRFGNPALRPSPTPFWTEEFGKGNAKKKKNETGEAKKFLGWFGKWDGLL